VTELTEPELRQEVLKPRRRVSKLTALLRLAVALLRTSGFRLTVARLPQGWRVTAQRFICASSEAPQVQVGRRENIVGWRCAEISVGENRDCTQHGRLGF
jgi:hypothetical protein